ncbi:MAG: hypothetical protein HRT57_01350 [Crocinitomicaceae bacterium]|nr:hypothetical protein [Crocinitomicaceae bacterium]
MSGGKETPRQKMIGMMYLVLTALLALNVSKSILDAFVAIEENTQLGNIAQVERGDGFIIAVRGEKGALQATDPKGNAAKIKSIDEALKQMDKINKITGVMIKSIDDIKIDILKKSGEAVDTYKDNDEESIMWIKYDGSKENQCRPIRMHLMAVQAKDQYDVPMHEIIGEEITNPTGSGKKLWTDLIQYRTDLMTLAGTYKWGGKQFKIDVKAINKYKDNKQLSKMILDMTSGDDVNPDDVEGLGMIYNRLTKRERNDVHDVKDVHWIGMTFDHAPLVAALASLSSMQQDILSARAEALYLWKQKISTGEYSFDKIMPLAYGPGSVRGGEEFKLDVMMAAFDSQNSPVVLVTEGGEGSKTTYNGGVGTVTLRAGGSSMMLKGTVTIKNKQGAEKTRKWEYEVPVITPNGAIELTDLNVLYRGYPNKVEISGSGYETVSLSGTASISKVGKGYIVKPGKGRSATLSVTGKNKDGTSKVLKTAKYRVSNLPDPTLYWGSAKSGAKGSKGSRLLRAKYPPEIPLKADFTLVSWTCYAPGLKGKPPTGSGGNIGGAGPLINALKAGSGISFTCKVRGPDGITRQIGGGWSL